MTQQKFNRGLPTNPLPLYLEGGMSLLIYESYIILRLRSKNEELLIPSTNKFYFFQFFSFSNELLTSCLDNKTVFRDHSWKKVTTAINVNIWYQNKVNRQWFHVSCHVCSCLNQFFSAKTILESHSVNRVPSVCYGYKDIFRITGKFCEMNDCYILRFVFLLAYANFPAFLPQLR